MLIVTGTIAYDYIMDFPGAFSDHILASQLHKINLSFIVDKFAKRRGGTAGNASYSLGMLKTPHILFSYAGNDFQEYKNAFKKVGILTNHVIIDRSQATATGFAMTDKADNQIWGYFYGAAENIPRLKLKNVAKKDDLVLIGPSGAAGSMSFVNQCIKKNISYMFDPGFILTQVSDKDLLKGVKHATYLIGNDYEITLMKKRVPKFDQIVKDKIVITTLGKNGATISYSGNDITIKGCTVKKPIDPTGAGDAWRSGFLAGIHQGFDLKTCGQIGAVAAAYAVEHYGTQEHKYTLAQFKKRYLQNYDHLLHL